MTIELHVHLIKFYVSLDTCTSVLYYLPINHISYVQYLLYNFTYYYLHIFKKSLYLLHFSKICIILFHAEFGKWVWILHKNLWRIICIAKKILINLTIYESTYRTCPMQCTLIHINFINFTKMVIKSKIKYKHVFFKVKTVYMHYY